LRFEILRPNRLKPELQTGDGSQWRRAVATPGILKSFHPPFARHALRFETNRAPAQTGFGVAIAGSFPKDIENMGVKNFSTPAKFGIMPKVMGSS